MSYQTKVYREQGGDTLVVASGGTVRAEAGSRLLLRSRPVEAMSVTDVTTAGAATLTAAALAGGIITRDPNGAARTDTTDTAEAIIAALGLVADGDCALCYLINTADAAETLTLQGGTGVTFANAAQTLAQNEAALLLLRRTGAAAVTVYILGA